MSVNDELCLGPTSATDGEEQKRRGVQALLASLEAGRAQEGHDCSADLWKKEIVANSEDDELRIQQQCRGIRALLKALEIGERECQSEEKVVQSLQLLCSWFSTMDLDIAAQVTTEISHDCVNTLISCAQPRGLASDAGQWALAALGELAGCSGTQDDETGDYVSPFCQSLTEAECAMILKASLGSLAVAQGEDAQTPALQLLVSVVAGRSSWTTQLAGIFSEEASLPLVNAAKSARANVLCPNKELFHQYIG